MNLSLTSRPSWLASREIGLIKTGSRDEEREKLKGLNARTQSIKKDLPP